MQSHRRLPKRSILGTRVSAPWSDGRFYCGVVESMTEQPNGQFMYSVLFDDGYSKLYFFKDIVGPGFSNVSGLFLKHGQKVFMTHQGREVSGAVVKHNRATNEVLIEVECSNGGFVEMVKRLDDIRLMESRKSARLNGSHNDYEAGQSVHIDVPRNRLKGNRRRKTADDQILEEPGEACENVEGIDADMQLAAMALQNLSCSPASPHFPVSAGLSKSPQSWNDRPRYHTSPSPPPSHYSLSAPTHSFFGSASTDEGIEVDDPMYQMDDIVSHKRRKGDDGKSSAGGVRYKCTWKGCNTVENDNDNIEKHVRDAHLGPRDSDISDHEEDFYYEEIEETEMEEMTANMEGMTCASPTQSSPLNLSLPRAVKQEAKPVPYGKDHDYNRKELLLLQQLNDQKSPPILIPGALPIHHKMQPPPSSAYIVPQNSPYSRQVMKTGSPLSPTTSSSPKQTHAAPRKSRSDIKKCRKVYGMENRDLWCTQCKWKKACTRFVPEVSTA